MRKRVAFSFLFAVIFIFPSLAGATSPEGFEPAKNLAAIWNLSAQPCNGGGGNAMQRHPQETTIKTSKAITLDSLGLRFTIPQLFDVQRTVLKLFMGDRSRGVIDNYLLISDNDLEPPFAAVVITELPEPMQNREEAFNAVNILQTQLAANGGIKLSLDRIDGRYGEGLELLVKNRVGTHCFPTADYQLLPVEHDISTYGISRFVLINNHLVEFSLIVVVPEEISDDEAVALARQSMDTFWSSLGPI